jgi:2,5-diketo-D-gluconate reductase A
VPRLKWFFPSSRRSWRTHGSLPETEQRGQRSQLGFGVFQVPPEQTQRVVEDALEVGYRHIDTAAGYGNEAGVGAAIAASGIPREYLFITTKLRNGQQGTAAQAFEASRQALGLDVIDLYLIHWPVPSQGLFVDAWRALEKIYAADGVRAIGVSNFLQDHLDTLQAETTVPPAVNQIELHPTFQQSALAAQCRAQGIAVEAYSPLGRGADLNVAAVTDLATTHGVTPAQIVLAWHLGVGNVVIPKTTRLHRMHENLAAAELTISGDEMESITALDSTTRIGADPAKAAFTQM